MRLLLATLAATAYAQNAKLVIVAQFKNEAESLPQWLHHYLNDEGVSTMLLVDDDSTDSWQKAVEPYGERVRVRSGHAHRHTILQCMRQVEGLYALPADPEVKAKGMAETLLVMRKKIFQ